MPKETKEDIAVIEPIISLEDFANSNLHLGIELLGGFIYEMRTKSKLCDKETNFRTAFEEFAHRPVS
ncbi:MAG: hypothetical protein ACYCX4_01720 [Bacillota bacterium]